MGSAEAFQDRMKITNLKLWERNQTLEERLRKASEANKSLSKKLLELENHLETSKRSELVALKTLSEMTEAFKSLKQKEEETEKFLNVLKKHCQDLESIIEDQKSHSEKQNEVIQGLDCQLFITDSMRHMEELKKVQALRGIHMMTAKLQQITSTDEETFATLVKT